MQTRKFFVLLATFTLLSFACSIGSFGNNGPTSQQDGTQYVDENGDPVLLNLSPRDAIDVMLEGISAGDQTLAEAVIDHLQIFIGEKNASDIYGEEEVLWDSLWGLTMLASESIDNDASDQEIEEIERLLNILMPPETNLDAYAAPEEEYTLLTQQFASIDGFAPHPQTEIDCRSVYDEGFPEGAIEPPICLLYRSFSASGKEYKIYYPIANRTDSFFMQHVDAATEALTDSQRKMDEIADVPSISLVFTLIQPVESATVSAAAGMPRVSLDESRSRACPMLVFPAGISGDLEKLKFIIAHETFHCVSGNRKGYIGYDVAKWFQEGMATYFANTVYPENNTEHMFLDDFAANSSQEWLMSMSYEATVFFQYLGNEKGDEYILGLHDALPAWGSSSQQAEALSAYDDMDTIFHEFGKEYLNGEIEDTGGGNLPFTLTVLAENVYQIEDGSEINASASAFFLARYSLAFESGKEYQIEKEPGGDEGQNAWRKESNRIFNEIPATLRSSCDERPHQIMLLTSAPLDASSVTETTIDLTFSITEEGEMDCCLVGTWAQPTDGIRANIQTVMSGSSLSLESISGRLLLSISEEHETYFYPENYQVTMVDPETDFWGRVNIVGESTNTFFVELEEGTITTANENQNFVVTMTGRDGTVSMPIDAAALAGGPFSDGGTFHYTCDETQMTVFTEGAAPFASSTFDRISPFAATPPAPDDPVAPSGGGDAPSDTLSGSSCFLISAVEFGVVGDTATWQIENNTTIPLDIQSIQMTFPVANGSRQIIRLNGNVIWEGDDISGLTPIDGGWSGTADQRLINPGDTATLEIVFSNDTIEATGYILVINFQSGCILSDAR